MILIGENVHIISKSVRSALESRDEIFINNLIEIQKNMDYVDIISKIFSCWFPIMLFVLCGFEHRAGARGIVGGF